MKLVTVLVAAACAFCVTDNVAALSSQMMEANTEATARLFKHSHRSATTSKENSFRHVASKGDGKEGSKPGSPDDDDCGCLKQGIKCHCHPGHAALKGDGGKEGSKPGKGGDDDDCGCLKEGTACFCHPRFRERQKILNDPKGASTTSSKPSTPDEDDCGCLKQGIKCHCHPRHTALKGDGGKEGSKPGKGGDDDDCGCLKAGESCPCHPRFKQEFKDKPHKSNKKDAHKKKKDVKFGKKGKTHKKALKGAEDSESDADSSMERKPTLREKSAKVAPEQNDTSVEPEASGEKQGGHKTKIKNAEFTITKAVRHGVILRTGSKATTDSQPPTTSNVPDSSSAGALSKAGVYTPYEGKMINDTSPDAGSAGALLPPSTLTLTLVAALLLK